MITLPNALTHANAQAVRDAGLQQLATGEAQGKVEVEARALQQFDSSALAVLLAWQRAAQARGQSLHCLNLSPELQNLAQVYGLETLLPV